MDRLCMEQGFHGRWQGVISKNYSFFSVKLLYNLFFSLWNLFEPLLSFWTRCHIWPHDWF
jgi:hypothetical protein